ncbi:hypothetical protein GUITHDRAFT_146370 [Guillardia theta CCMP2712]|uniref:Uncharacterized protein n=1 Tax=Guillardia theta (strain CCMP2712) TaxID=905079 RepID=L1IGZ9_GUITC|nr:hypothetical protein GUITHDRAFT_146370 [Guillardia theta CCMP2712]EKX35536.1 hypothetical protein GUITHDRAFT_146370 [Guillardia theta CCMP2712]|eukprot:XP_005822516.1 hypothetical protein GUITHDRAFT_146370 [Guillardia theta CCMP2712]
MVDLAEDSEVVVMIEGKDRLFCRACKIELAGIGPKVTKQHLKSKTHKQSLRGLGASESNESESKPHVEKQINAGDPENCRDEPCQICLKMGRIDTRHSLESFKDALEAGETVRPCFPPPFVRSPKSLFPGCKHPFITFESGSLEEVPDNLEDCLELFCNAGANEGNKPPNIDINGVNFKAKSLSNARRTLLQADASGDMYWAALVVDSIKHPLWWPRKDRNVCVGVGDVPNFNQVIIGSGHTDIGIHIDNAPRPSSCSQPAPGEKIAYDMVDHKDPQYSFCLSAGEESVHVDTYITMARGCKYVIMLPSGGNFFGDKQPFPKDVDFETMSKIVNAGGYYFSLEPVDPEQHVTLFTPKSWHHWLLGMSDWHLIFGASRF